MKSGLMMKDMLRVTTAEMWLRLGDPRRALQELNRLPKKAWQKRGIQKLAWRAALAIAFAEHPPQVQVPRRVCAADA
ncbi:MAG TPA: hypothetical protein VN578_22550 [Candidatus Binatia bacterium]|jgi:hypothetical protein|nr:hypothetical protein [Candidatus Binatia bacterium]